MKFQPAGCLIMQSFAPTDAGRLHGIELRPMAHKNEDKGIAEFIRKHSLHAFELDLASKVLSNQKMSLLQKFYWERIKKKYSSRR